jgi:hypothetical protein
MTSRLVGMLVVASALAACATPTPSDGPTGSEGAASQSESGQLASGAPAATPGHPYDADELLTAMRGSTRPGGVPDQLETDAIAAALAEQIWTWDGEPWAIISVGAACGESQCSVDVAGSKEGVAGADLYTFNVSVGDGTVDLVTTDLRAYPAALDASLDRVARAAGAAELGALSYAGAQWLPPPDEDRYRLAYRSGGEEGAPGVDLLLDLATGEVLELEPL